MFIILDFSSCKSGNSLPGIRVLKASYGRNCNFSNDDNQTDNLRKFCDGLTGCFYRIDKNIIGDPANGCQKHYDVLYMCKQVSKTISIKPEANGKILHLDCTPGKFSIDSRWNMSV